MSPPRTFESTSEGLALTTLPRNMEYIFRAGAEGECIALTQHHSTASFN
jgi:hypothetical protein